MDLKVWDPRLESSSEAEGLDSCLHSLNVAHALTCLLCRLTGFSLET